MHYQKIINATFWLTMSTSEMRHVEYEYGTKYSYRTTHM
jgi:hypothetical protein